MSDTDERILFEKKREKEERNERRAFARAKESQTPIKEADKEQTPEVNE